MKADFHKDQQELALIMDALKDIVRILLVKLRDHKNKKMKSTPHLRLGLCNALIVIQNIIAVYGAEMVKLGTTKFFEEISGLCIRLLPQTKKESI